MARAIERLQSGHGWRLTDDDLDAVAALARAHLGGPDVWHRVHPSRASPATPTRGPQGQEVGL